MKLRSFGPLVAVALAAACHLPACAQEETPPVATGGVAEPANSVEEEAEGVGGGPVAAPQAQITSAPVAVAQVAPAPDPTWPSVPYSAFMPTSPDPARRQTFWGLFRLAEREAHQFASSPARWVPLTQVVDLPMTAGLGDWSHGGRIEIRQDRGPGTMFHEIFHTVMHPSELNVPDGDSKWTEGFCDAFRYAAEKELLAGPPGGWERKMTKLTEQTEDKALGGNPSVWKTKYAYPAALIVKRSGRTMTGLRALWFQLIALKQQRGGGPVLNDFFGYTPH